MTTRAMSFSVRASDFDPVTESELRDAERSVERIRADFIAKFCKSERFKAARDLAKMNNYGSAKIEPTVSISGGRFEVHIVVDEISGVSHKPQSAPLHIDPKLANSLLNSKILTDAEKRAMIDRLAPGIITTIDGDDK